MPNPAVAGSPATPGGRALAPSGDPLLTARFAVPAPPKILVHRPALLTQLSAGARGPLTLVNGPAGAGKTVLTSHWIAEGRGPRATAWLTVEATDTPGTFWAYVLESLRRAGVRMPAEVGSPARAEGVDRRLLTRLAAALSEAPGPVVLVLDEFDALPSPEVADGLAFLLRHAAPGLRLVLTGRTEPLLPLHRYRAAGEVTEIRNADLRFTTADAAQLLGGHGLALSEEGVRTLVERTEGWAAGLRLGALAMQRAGDPEAFVRGFEADRASIADYLLNEVLEAYPAPTQDLLLRASVTERIHPALADALTGRRDAEWTLAMLARANAFLEPVDGSAWYRLHPLFAEVLHAHLRHRRPGLEPRLRRRAARWLADAGRLTEAEAQAAAAGDWRFAAEQLVGQLAIVRLLTGLDADRLSRLFAPMPTGLPGPATALVEAALRLGDHDAAGCTAALRRADSQLGEGKEHGERDQAGGEEQAGDDGSPVGAGQASARPGGEDRRSAAVQPATDRPGRPPAADGGGGSDSAPLARGDERAARLCSAVLAVLAAQAAGDPCAAADAAARAERLMREVPQALLGRHPELRALVLAGAGAAELGAGRLGPAERCLTAAVAACGAPGTECPHCDSLGSLALVELLGGRLRPAQAHARALLDLAERSALPPEGPARLAHLVLAGVAIERDDLATATAQLDLATTATTAAGATGAGSEPVAAVQAAVIGARLARARSDWPTALALLRAAEADLRGAAPWTADELAIAESAVRLAQGDPDAALAALDGVASARPEHTVARARALLAAGRPDGAGAAAEALAGLTPGAPGWAFSSVSSVSVTTRVQIHLVGAQAAEAAGDETAALMLLGQALALARPEELRRLFVESGAWVRRLLARDRQLAQAHGWLPLPLPGRARADAGDRLPALIEPLSGRERDVLRQAAQMLSTDEIAAELHVSANTVKTHLKSVFRKLGVTRRSEAVRRARALGLL
ncbi:LuxR C-terminal-related transcriptional regulator [Kitasatospora sp. NPDC050543]|uniref:LuxR C-terminal-related transcriptional regulator n=1 Tax=Kitasatospora sp. NPDC050543 TaxID=3364054 RepID=UPI0037AB0BB1